MKKTFSKILTALLCATLVFSVFSIGAFAAEDYSGTCGADLTWTLDIMSGELEISGTGDMTSYLLTSPSWADYREDIKSIVINEGVTSIGNFAFKDCTNLVTVSIPDGVEMVSGSAFAGCTSLIKVTLPDTVTLIGNNAFKGCTSLEYVHIPSSVTTIGKTILADTDAYICSESIECYAKTYAEENGYTFETCKITLTAIIEYIVFLIKQLLAYVLSLFV